MLSASVCPERVRRQRDSGRAELRLALVPMILLLAIVLCQPVFADPAAECPPRLDRGICQ